MTDRLYQTVEEFAQDAGVSPRRIRVICRQGRIPGAYKHGRDWMIPAAATWDRKPPGRPWPTE